MSLVLTLSVAGGCRSPAEQTTVTGAVTFDGKPLPRGVVVFVPTEARGGGYPVLAQIQPDGRFAVARDAEGRLHMAGDYMVTVSARESDGEADGFETASSSLIPGRYSDHTASGLRATIRAGEPNELSFNLVK